MMILDLDTNDLGIIATALGDRPFKEVNPLIIKINQQLTEQQKPSGTQETTSAE